MSDNALRLQPESYDAQKITPGAVELRGLVLDYEGVLKRVSGEGHQPAIAVMRPAFWQRVRMEL